MTIPKPKLEVNAVENLWGQTDPRPGDVWKPREFSSVWVYNDMSAIGNDTARQVPLGPNDFVTVLSDMQLSHRDRFVVIRIMVMAGSHGQVIGWVKLDREDYDEQHDIITLLRARNRWNKTFERCVECRSVR